MTTPRRLFALALVFLVISSGIVLAQRGRYRQRSMPSDRNGVPVWEVEKDYPGDLFTFVRVRYDSVGRWGGGWAVDYPDSDLNFSLRLHQLTTLKVNPEPLILDLTDDRIFDHPFLYMIEPGSLYFSDAEVAALRRYCLNGGFLMVDDFWGDSEYENLRMQLKRVFPEREPFEVPLSHEIFHCVYDLKEKPQIPSVHNARRGGGTWEYARDGSDTSVPHYRAITDDEDRIMVFICHNTDLGDGWEQEAADPWYFEEFSVKKAYPMGINIIMYAMTH